MTPFERILTLTAHEKESLSLFFAYSSRSVFSLQHSPYLGAIRTERLKEAMGGNVNKVPTMHPRRSAELILQLAVRRQRQQVMTLPGKFMVWLNHRSPALVDRILGSIPSLSYQE